MGIKIMLSLAFASLTAVLAQVALPLPWTPVPLTGQTYAVLLAGVLLGRWGAVSQIMYIGLGFAGVPLFAGGSAAALSGATAGYLAGFVVSAFIIGSIVDTQSRFCRGARLTVFMLAVNLLVIHGLGIAWLYVWKNAITGSAASFITLLLMGSIPFVPGDIIKVLLAAGTSRFVLHEDNSDKLD